MSLYARSTLVVEVVRNNIRKFYLIPTDKMSEPQSRYVMKRGTKLHIFNEHSFVAIRVPGKTACDVCQRHIGRSLHKQAYQCRDCRIITHKTCHYKMDGFCQASNVASINIEYISPNAVA